MTNSNAKEQSERYISEVIDSWPQDWLGRPDLMKAAIADPLVRQAVLEVLSDFVRDGDATAVWGMYVAFAGIVREQERDGLQLNWFSEPPVNSWISATAQRISEVLATQVDEQLELLWTLTIAATDHANPSREVSLKKAIAMMKANPRLIERDEPDALKQLGDSIQQKLEAAVGARNEEFVFSLFHKVEHDSTWWRTIWYHQWLKGLNGRKDTFRPLLS